LPPRVTRNIVAWWSGRCHSAFGFKGFWGIHINEGHTMTQNLSLTAALAALLSLACVSAQAVPVAPIGPAKATADVILVAGGCGPGRHRDRIGACVPNVVVVAPPVVVAPGAPVVVAPAVVCGAGYRWHPRFRRCVVL
jgi:hypothetical protein